MMKQEDGTMKQIINSKHLSTLIFILSIIVSVKLLWTIVSFIFLPNSGEEHQEEQKAKKLYYRVKLGNESISRHTQIDNTPQTHTQVASMRGYKLLGLYNATDTLVVTVEKSNKTTILAKGENINGFELFSAGSTYAIFKKSGKEFKLNLINIKNTKLQSTRSSSPHSSSMASSSSGKGISEVGGVKVVSRDLLTSYTKDMDKIFNDISIAPNNNNGKIDGFKINFVKRGSDFAKLGLRSGDILKAINAQELDSLRAGMDFFKDINNIENLTLTVERNGKSEDMEYEIK